MASSDVPHRQPSIDPISSPLSFEAPAAGRTALLKMVRPSGMMSQRTNFVVSVLLRVGAHGLIAAFLPALLARRLPPQDFANWSLVLVAWGYVNIVDIGLHLVVIRRVSAAPVADRPSVGRSATMVALIVQLALVAIPFGLLGVAAGIGIGPFASATQTGHVPAAVLLIGGAAGINALATPLFGYCLVNEQGLRAAVGTFLSRFVGAGVIAISAPRGISTMAAILMISSLAGLAWTLVTARRTGFKFRRSLGQADLAVRPLLSYSLTMAIWSVSAFMVSGLDVLVADHAERGSAAYVAPIVAILGIVATIHQTYVLSNVEHMGSASGKVALQRATLPWIRRCVLLGSSLLFAIYGVAWVGGSIWLATYWDDGRDYFFLASAAIGVRMLTAPINAILYASVRSSLSRVGAGSEGLLNLTLSILLARWLGVNGVALGSVCAALIVLLLVGYVGRTEVRRASGLPCARLLVAGALPFTIAIAFGLLTAQFAF